MAAGAAGQDLTATIARDLVTGVIQQYTSVYIMQVYHFIRDMYFF